MSYPSAAGFELPVSTFHCCVRALGPLYRLGLSVGLSKGSKDLNSGPHTRDTIISALLSTTCHFYENIMMFKYNSKVSHQRQSQWSRSDAEIPPGPRPWDMHIAGSTAN